MIRHLLLLALLALSGGGRAQSVGTGMGTGMGTSGPSSAAAPRASLDDARSQELSILTQLQRIDEELAEVQGDLVTLEEKVQELEGSKASSEEDLQSADTFIDGQREFVARQLSALYRLHRQGLARVIFGATDPADLRRRSVYLLHIIDEDLRKIQAFRAALSTKREAVASVERDVRALDALRSELEDKADELKEQRRRRLELLEDIRSRRELTLQAMGEMRQVHQELGDQLGREKHLVDTASAQGFNERPGTPPGDASGAFRAAYGRLPWPVAGRVQNASIGQGVDIQAEYGTPVRAVFGGTVRLAGYVRGYG